MIRNLDLKDIEQIINIEKSVHIAPWTKETFHLCFQAGFYGWVCEVEDTIIGFIIVSIIEKECHVLNLCVSNEYQKKGFGSLLLQHLLDTLNKKGVQIVYLEVRRSNEHAIGLYKKFNFQMIGERKNYYPAKEEGHEDALIYVKLLVSTDSFL